MNAAERLDEMRNLTDEIDRCNREIRRNGAAAEHAYRARARIARQAYAAGGDVQHIATACNLTVSAIKGMYGSQSAPDSPAGPRTAMPLKVPQRQPRPQPERRSRPGGEARSSGGSQRDELGGRIGQALAGQSHQRSAANSRSTRRSSNT